MGRRGRSNLINESFFFVTTTIVKFYPLFANPVFSDLLIENIKHYQNKFNFEILAYVIMPSHLHWIIKTDNTKGTISDVMRDIKKYSSKQITRKLLEFNNEVVLNLFKSEASNIPDQDYKVWMKRFDDQVIRNEKMLCAKIKYIHNNPVEAGLVEKPEDYKYSSVRNYIENDHNVLQVETCYAGIEMV